MTGLVESGSYVMAGQRDIPWHGLGNPMDPDKTYSTEEILVASGLEWGVVQYEVWSPIEGEWVVIPTRFTNVRSDKLSADGILGVVGSKYQVYENRDLVEFGQTIIAEVPGARWDTAWSLDGGRTVCATFKLPTDVLIGGDEMQGYLTVANTHDGSAPLRAFVSRVRVVCMNTLRAALGSMQTSFTIRHTTSMSGRVNEARKALAITTKEAEVFAAAVEEMLQATITDNEFHALVQGMIPPVNQESTRARAAEERRSAQIDGLMWTFKTSPTIEGMRGTAWGAYNAITEWAQWDNRQVIQRGSGSQAERQMKSILSGRAYDLETFALGALKELAGIS